MARHLTNEKSCFLEELGQVLETEGKAMPGP